MSHQVQCDVLIVASESASAPALGGGSIVVGTDGSSSSTRAVRVAIRISKALGGELHVVSSSSTSDPALAAAVAEVADQGVSATTHALEGDPADALLDVARQHGAVIVVVGSKGLQAGERDWFGNVAGKLSHSGTSNVLIAFAEDTGASDAGAMSAAATSQPANI